MAESLMLNEFEKSDINALSALSLAYIGDAVWEIYARQHILYISKTAKVNKLHKLTTNLVKAHSQFVFVQKLKDESIIDDELWQVVLRGRNSSYNAPKNADVQEYNYATGFESLIGFLYLEKRFEKIDEIARFCLKNADKFLNDN
ncbi:Mini-ribonuclease 3 [Criibacterium bergeronii]|uniref:Mini-ribonuclease 3 n=1 Tax=Criibacterium bergeronii TaxID=1871336 RepID=A0A371IK13_9FIRM|nr:ribonuclease III domain-containing protein [Criibacterium bergeronii]RDY20819.1 ribonuclease III [Criibacterium bergeronii]TRW25550.1 ribonuclease III [Criibacterium bergeronii]